MKRLPEGRRRWLIRRARREAKRRWRRALGRSYGDAVRAQNIHFPALPARPYFVFARIIPLTGSIDLVADTDENLAQLTELDRIEPVNGPMRIKIDLQAVESIEPAGLLFLCSRIKKLAARPFVEVTGTWPPDESEALRVLRDADFHSFLKSEPIPHVSGAKTLSLIDGTTAGHRHVSPEIASRIHSFLGGLHPKLTTRELDALGVAVTECLENVRVHAYGEKEERRQGWYVVGRYEEVRATSTVAILDMGVGFAATVAKRFPFKGRFKSNVDMLEAATTGLVTATGEPNRGKGYRFLREFVDDADGRLLHVLSSSAMITWGRGGNGGIVEKRATQPFTGTIVCLQITNR